MPKSKSEKIFNRDYNLIATHAKCNQKKSDKVDFRVIQGYSAKMFGGVIGAVLNPIIRLVTLPLRIAPKAITGILNLFGNMISFSFGMLFKVITSTFTMVFSLLFKPILIIVAIIAIILYTN